MKETKRVTIMDIAKIAGVSPGAVSFALNGRPGVSDRTRQRILAIAEELHWQPSAAARVLSGARAGVIGFAVNRSASTFGTEAFFSDLIAGMQSALIDEDIAMQLTLVASIEDEVSLYRRWSGSQQVDGVVVIDPREDDPRLAALRDLRLPSVVIGSQPSLEAEPASIWLDDGTVARTLFDYLGALGHRSLAFVTGPADFQHTTKRASAFRELGERGITGEVAATDFSPAAAASATRDLLSRVEAPTAIVYDNDVMAIAGLRVAQEMGVSVPADLSLASFDDSVVAGLVRPSITCLTRDTVALGADTARFLLEQIASPTILDDRTGPLPRLTVRESTAALR